MKMMFKIALALMVMAWLAPVAMAAPQDAVRGGIEMGKGGGKPAPTPKPIGPTKSEDE